MMMTGQRESGFTPWLLHFEVPNVGNFQTRSGSHLNSNKPNSKTRMKTLSLLLLSAALTVTTFAGTPAASSGKSVQPYAPQVDNCWAPGFTMGTFAGGMFPSHGSSGVAGGGVLGEYFWTENFGFQGAYGIYATSSEHHQFDGSLIYRMPMDTIAPYIMAGGGVGTNATTRGDFHVGGGIEARIASMNCLGIFMDGNYHFATGSGTDFTIARLGLKFRF